MELRSSEFLDQSNTYNLCSLNTAFTFRKSTSHICNHFSFNYANAFVWMRHTLNWLKWSCPCKAKTAPEHLLGMFYIPHWHGDGFNCSPFPIMTNLLCFPWTKKSLSSEGNTFFQFSTIQFLCLLPVIIFPSSFFWVRSCFLVVS